MLKPRLRRWIARLLLAATAFGHASVAFAECSLERGQLSQAIAPGADAPCPMETHVKKNVPRYANRCLAHCTADLKAVGLPVAIVRGAAGSPVLFVPSLGKSQPIDTGLESAPPGTPPPRILLHSLLI
jgi:hypothetical protein